MTDFMPRIQQVQLAVNNSDTIMVKWMSDCFKTVGLHSNLDQHTRQSVGLHSDTNFPNLFFFLWLWDIFCDIFCLQMNHQHNAEGMLMSFRAYSHTDTYDNPYIQLNRKDHNIYIQQINASYNYKPNRFGLCCLMTPGLSKDIWVSYMTTLFSEFAIQQIRHNVGSQPGDYIWSL